MSISVVLADHHPIIRQGLRSLLEAEPDFKIVGEAQDGLEAVRMVERLGPDVLVLNLMMPHLSGLQALPTLRQRAPQTRVVALSTHAEETFVVEALRGGASGYLLKGCKLANFVKAIREAAADRRFLSPNLPVAKINALMERTTPTIEDPYATLTPREREVLQLAAEGHTNAEIASKLFLSPRTIEMHRANLMRKLGLKTATELVRFAIRRGIIPLHE
jgi:DNA-binding NarL/FixJ family response regulator